MKNVLFSFKRIIVLMFVAQYLHAAELLVPIEHVFTPKGFDTNDNTEILISGYLPNLCYRSPKSIVKIKKNVINIQVTAYNHATPSTFCPLAIVPFLESVSVGLLKKGDYSIVVNGKTMFEKKSSISIVDATAPVVDNFIYADVEYVEKNDQNRTVELKGYNPSDCFELSEIKTISNSKDTYSVLPIMKKVRDFCPLKLVPFTYKYEVPNELHEKKVLLHVRSMKGKSVNTLFFNEDSAY